ncbi:MAG: flagellar biosynthesis protein FlhF [Nitrospinae bacterium RIFCSPLOWO2_12_FULL_45_22]|nr:MAG: flagellar biosynthesis protein FlhF [Nitrospinae bacterium RIFCSPLOWO2_12_FULL_45_22]
MKIKRYEAIDMQEAINQIKQDLGPDALILSVKKIRRGCKAFSLFSRPILEVTAAHDIPPPGELPQKQEYYGTELLLESLQREFMELKTLLLPKSYEREIYTELRELKELISLLRPKNGSGSSPTSPTLLSQHLIAQGIDSPIAHELLLRVRKHLKNKRKIKPDQLRLLLLNEAQNMLPTRPAHEGQRVMVLLGPTGVGKTTTIAKLAGEYGLVKKQKVTIITIDTYRVASIEQLKIYGNTLGLPVHIALSPSDLKRFLSINNDKDLILIDTHGCNPKDKDQLLEMQRFLPLNPAIENHLVLSITTKEKDLKSIISRFHTIPIHCLLFTKLDESDSYGAIFNQAIWAKKPVSFLTTGQKVPEDIEIATPERITQLALNIPFNLCHEEEPIYGPEAVYGGREIPL